MDSEKSIMTTIIIVAAAILLGIVGYFLVTDRSNSNPTKLDDNEIINTDDERDDYNTDDTNIYSVTGAYSSDAGDSLVKDAEEKLTGMEEMELILNEDGTGKIGLKDEIITGNYTSTVATVTFAEVVTTAKENQNRTFEFTINSDNTLTYISNEEDITLSQIDTDKLRYLK